MGLHEQITGAQLPALPSHEVGAVWRCWIDGIFDLEEMWGDPSANPVIPPKMEWTPQTRIDLEAMETRHKNMGLPQQSQYFTLVESIFVGWIAGLITKQQGEDALF